MDMTDEKRTQKRFKAPVGTVMYTADSMRQIVDIGIGGFSLNLKHLDRETFAQKQKTVDILLGGTLLREVPVTVAWEEQPSSAGKDAARMGNVVGVKFANLTEQQRALINDFISRHITGNA
ncbi:MAG: PilZ domain-containing protein [Thermodesulfobacteriota bacterium]